MSFALQGQRALVVGAAGGIGEATAQVMAGLGADLVLVDRVAPDALAERIRVKGALLSHSGAMSPMERTGPQSWKQQSRLMF